MTRPIDSIAYLKKVCAYKQTGCGSCSLQTICPADEPEIEAIPIEFIQKKIETIRQYLEKHGGETDIEEFVDGLISKALTLEGIIEDWRAENGTETD